MILHTVISPNIVQPLTLCTSPSDYGTFNQIRSFLILIAGCFWKEKTAKGFHFLLSLLSRGGFRQKLANVVKNFLPLISNDTGFKAFTLNQVIDEVNCCKQPDLTFPGIYLAYI